VTHHTTTSTNGQAARLSHRLLIIFLATLGFALMLGAGSASAVVIRSQVEVFGADGTNGSSFAAGSLRDLAFNQGTQGLYAVEQGAPGIFGFDVSVPPTHQPLAGFSPLATVATGGDPGIAVDNTALPSAGNVYFVSESTGLVYGFDKTGAPLGGNFPIDPAATPGAPQGSPKDICGAGVDSAGNLWVANFSTQNLLKYSSAGIYQASISTAGQGFRPCSVAFDSNDDMYATEGGGPSGPTYKYSAASGYTAATLVTSSSGRGNAVDRTTHHLFTINNANTIGEYDSAGNPLSIISEKDSTGAVIIPTASGIAGAEFKGVAVDSASDRLYVADESLRKIRVFGPALTYPDLTLGTASGIENTAATVGGAISPQGLALSDCRFEYVSEVAFGDTGFSDLSSGGSAPCTPSAASVPADSATHSVSAALGGLTTNSGYRFRLVGANASGSIATLSNSFETSGPALVETTGSPVRTTTTARLDSRVSPSRAPATYHFEYGEQGPCDSNPCTATDPQSAGSGNVFMLVSQQIEGLQPNTTYHYRVVADNGNPAGPTFGEDMTMTTRGDEAPLSHGQLSGPAGSDRAWEMVSAPDTSGNPVGAAFAQGADTISDAGDRAVYGVAGGTPDSESGTVATRLFAQRTPSGWQTKRIYAPRDEATGAQWSSPGGPSDLSTLVSENWPGGGFGEFSFWRLSPEAPPTKLFSAPDKTTARGGFLATSETASRVLVTLIGSHDPEHPVGPTVEPNASSQENLYDISSGSPQLVGLLPDGSVPACGVVQGTNDSGLPEGSNRFTHWVTADGSLAFFPSRDHQSNSCHGLQRIYLRDFGTETTKSISSPVVSGPECDAYFIKSTPGAAFIYTVSRLAVEDREPPSVCGGNTGSNGDIYRYDLGDGSMDCVTCVVPGLDARVTFSANAEAIGGKIGIANDGSRIYFTSGHRLLPGAPTGEGIYRLNVASGELAYLGSFGFLGEYEKSVLSPDGSVVVFSSNDPSLNALGGQQNAGTSQYYRYDDNDRSLICISCPTDGSAPKGGAGVDVLRGEGANLTPLSSDGGIFAFSTPTPLVAADQNTAGPGQNPEVGTDVYEWREGRLLLVSDGLTSWPSKGGETPEVSGITPSGHDIFFVAAAQYTQDALDGYRRLYDARIGGGFEFPPKPKPCPLEVCQGIPKGAPEEAAPGTASITGLGNVKRPGRIVCAKPKRKVRKAGKTRCVKPKPAHKKANRQRANHERRTQR
jgi:hypothetical protein